MFLSSTERAQRERDQRSRERQLKRQVAGPIPPESWRDDFDRLSIRRGVASHFDRQRLQDLISSTTIGRGDDADSSDSVDTTERDRQLRQRARKHHAAVCAGLRHHLDSADAGYGGKLGLSLRDMALCVIADALNRPSLASRGKGKDHGLGPDMDRLQLREVLEYLPRHMRDRMMALCGRLAVTDWPLSKWTAQALVDLDRPRDSALDRGQAGADEEADDDWENSINSDTPSLTRSSAKDGVTTLDLSFTTISPRTLNRMLTTTAVSLTTLSLAGFNTTLFSSTISLDSPQMHSLFAQLPNLRLLSLAGSSLSRFATVWDGGMDERQRSGVFLRKLSRSLTKLETLDLGFCRWVSADAMLAVSWSSRGMLTWPRLKRLLLGGCEAVVDPRTKKSGLVESSGGFVGKAAGNHVGQWHATHTQRYKNSATESTYDADTDTRQDPFDLSPTPTRSSARANFSDYVNNAIQPAIITHMIPRGDTAAEGGSGVLMEYVRCPRSAGKVEMWQWQRARILDAVRGRAQPLARQRGWIDVYF